MEACPSTLPETSLAHLVTSLMARVDCSAASREAIIPVALAIAESFVRQVPTDGMGLGLVRVSCCYTNCSAINHTVCRSNVKCSTAEMLDSAALCLVLAVVERFRLLKVALKQLLGHSALLILLASTVALP
jgi:hypothetical protein